MTANDIADLEAKLDDTVCAVMLEYIQGEGGVNALEQAFVDAVFESVPQKTCWSLRTKCRPVWAELVHSLPVNSSDTRQT